MLKIQFKDQRQPPIRVVEKRYTIGHAQDNHLPVNDDSLDALHARLLTINDSLYLKDNNSRQGCYVNDQRITEKELLPGDTIRLGNVEFDILDPHELSHSPSEQSISQARHWLLVADSGTLSGQEFLLPTQTCTIGRSSDCDISIPASHLARQHAEFTIQGSELRVRDLGSASGVYINDERTLEGTIQSGDRLRLDVYRFQVIGPETGEKKRQRRNAAPINPVKRKITDTGPKQWKTKPTSPGNRSEPEPGQHRSGLLLLSLLLCGTLAAVLVYFLFVD